MSIWHAPNLPLPKPPLANDGGVLVQVREMDTTNPIPGALVVLDIQGGQRFAVTANGNGDAWCWTVPKNTPVVVTITADGYRAYDHQPYGGFGADNTDLPIGLTRNTPPPPKPRPPLPPFPACGSCPSPLSYDKTLPWDPPQTRDFLRADAWGVEIPGLPFVPGGSSEHPERCLTWFLDRWSPEWQQRIIDEHRARSYTHFVLSAPDSMRNGAGFSLSMFVDLCRRVKDAGLAPLVFLGSKVYQPRDQSLAQWTAYLYPLLTALFDADCVAEVVPAWEWDLFNVPGSTTVQVSKYVGQLAHQNGVSCWLHFSTHVTSWFADGDARGRYGFWDDLAGDVDGLLYQGDPAWDIGQLQSRLVDTLKQFAAQGNRHKLRAFELDAMSKFTRDRPSEDDSNGLGYLACCTQGPAPVWGFGGGGRRVNGTPL